MIDEEKNKKILLVIIIISVLGLGIYKLFFDNKKVDKEIIDTKTISVVDDKNRFFTVSSCVSKFINYLDMRETDNLLLLLNDKYEKDNNVNSSNFYNYFTPSNSLRIFSPKKMFVQRMSKTLYKYYVFGYVEEELMDMYGERNNYYIIIYLDGKNMTFSVEPYDGSMFK